MITDTNAKVAILGISDKEERYSFLAYTKLLENGYMDIYGVSPKLPPLENIKNLKTINELPKDIHTLTLYVGSKAIGNIIDDILKLAPKRIIMNPGTENENLEEKALGQNIEVIRGCTLVMLSTNQF